MAMLFGDHPVTIATQEAFARCETTLNRRFVLRTFLPSLQLVGAGLCGAVFDRITAATSPAPGGVGKTLPDRVAIGGGDQMARVGVAVGKKISPDVNCAAGATAPARPWPDVSGPCHHPQGPSDARQNAWPHQHGSPWHTCAIQKGACHLAGTAALGASRLTGRGCSVRSASGQNLGFHRPV